jgi:serine/threonine-protein kinase
MTTPQQWQAMKRLFAESREQAPDQRDAFLDDACSGQPDMAQEVRLLLAADRGDDFLEPPDTSGAADASAEDANAVLGHRIGPYRIERLVGHGGMGNVYFGLRVEGGFDQRVAIKLLKRGMDTDSVVQQFRREQQTLAMLVHPCIARLYDGGATPDGRPYFIMEYVEGIPIDRYCHDRRLSITQRLDLFLAMCDAVGYAHQHLVVHRDLKPANILVAGDGIPKLLDFGIAKLLSDAEPGQTTAPIERRLTLEYASPEQVTGQRITTLSDIYSLGVILYELLTGIRPYAFRTRSTSEIEATICNTEPPAPSVAVARQRARPVASTEREEASPRPVVQQIGEDPPERLVRQLRGDLDTIVLATLRKEPERRYSSVEAFAADIRRFLGGMPVAARKDTFAYRARKFMGRHRTGTAAMVLLAVVLTVGAVGIVRYARLSERQRDLADAERHKAEQLADAAARERDEAYQARDQAEAITLFLHDALSAADPGVAGPDLTVRELLDAASARLESDFASRPLLQAAVRSTVGRTYNALGLYDDAESHLIAAYKQRVDLLGDDHHDVAESRTDLAGLRYSQGRFDEAETLLRQSLEAHERLRGPLNLDTARVCNDLAAVLLVVRKLDEAEHLHRRALRAYEQLIGRESAEVARSLNNLANVYRYRGDLTQAREALVEALRIRQALLAPGHPMVIQSMHNLALTDIMLGHTEQAIPVLREVVESGRNTFGDDHPDVAISLRSLGGALMTVGDYAEAEPLLRQALGIFESRLPDGHPRRVATSADLGRCLLKTGRFDEAERVLNDVLNSRPPERPLEGPWAEARADLIELFKATGRPEKAAELN